MVQKNDIVSCNELKNSIYHFPPLITHFSLLYFIHPPVLELHSFYLYSQNYFVKNVTVLQY